MNTEYPKVTGSPDAIWLNYGDIEEDCTHADATSHADSVTWCDVAQDHADVKYVRADIVATLEAENAELADVIQRQNERMDWLLNRLEFVYKENPNVYFILTSRRIIEQNKSILAKRSKQNG